MMNIKQNKGLFALLLLAVLTACTSEDNITNSKQLIEVGGDKLKIVINEEPFDVETTAQTRAGGVAQAIPAGTVDLGDGLEAEVSIRQGTPAPKTRATVVSDGHYNIYAYDANTNQMLIGPNKKLSGNVVGGVFTPDAGSRLELEAGTYKFVCCTDGVGLDQTYGTGDAGFWYRTQLDIIGATEQTISGDDQQIVFLMYHRAARFRFRLTGYTNQLTDVKAQFGLGMRGCHHGYITIPTGFSGPSTAIGDGYYAKKQPIRATPAQQSTTYPLANEFLSDYTYLTCDGSIGGILLNLSGTIYGKPVNIQDKQLYFVHYATLKDNGTYTINLKLKPTPALYLFQDGSCGALAEKGSRKVIGIVVTEKTASDKGLAAALNFTPNVIWEQDNPPAGSGNSYQNNTVCYPNPNAGLADMNGYNWTWDAASSLDGKVRGDEQTKYPAFYVAGHYNPGVTVTGANVGKWFLPSWGQLMEFFKLTAKDLTMPTGSNPSNPWFGANPTFSDGHALEKLNNYIIQAGGNGLPHSFVSTSTQVDGTPTYRSYQPAGCALNFGSGDDNIQVFAIWKTMSNGGVLPFVHF